ncbi:unnamed protein product, partial [Nesidiocoris tenuis]
RVSIPSAQCWIAARPDRTSGVGSFFELVFCALARFFEKNSTAEKIRWYTRCRKNKKRPRREIGGPVFPTLKNLNFERYRQRETPISQPGGKQFAEEERSEKIADPISGCLLISKENIQIQCERVVVQNTKINIKRYTPPRLVLEPNLNFRRHLYYQALQHSPVSAFVMQYGLARPSSVSAEISTDSTDRWPAHRVKVITRFF